MKSSRIVSILLVSLVFLLFVLEVIFGSVDVSLSELKNVLLGNKLPVDREFVKDIIFESRIPRALTALLAGSGLALCGLLMQSLFRNPLAGPSVLGISSGASLGVSVVIAGGIGFGFSNVWLNQLSISLAAMIGAFTVLSGIIAVSVKLRDHISLLIFGLMVGYLCSALVTIVEFGASKEAIRTFVFWGMGSFAAASYSQIFLMSIIVIVGSLISLLLCNKLNVMLLGEDYAKTMGLHFSRLRLIILLITGASTGIITAFCGPIAFLGLAVPHLARGLVKSGDHKVLMPAVLLSGAAVAMLCDLISRLPGSDYSLPLNAVTSLIGAPIVIAIIFKNARMKSWF